MLNKYRVTKSEYEKEKPVLLAKYENNGFQEYQKFSLNKQVAKDIVMRTILTIDAERETQPTKCHDNHFICWSYVLNRSDLDEDLLDALIYITSGLFDICTWDKEVIDFVVDLVSKGPEYDCAPDLLAVANGNFNLPKRYVKFIQKLVASLYQRNQDKLGEYKARFLMYSSVVGESFDKEMEAHNYIMRQKGKLQQMKSSPYFGRSEILAQEKKITQKQDWLMRFKHTVKTYQRNIPLIKNRIEELENSLDVIHFYTVDRLDWKSVIDNPNLNVSNEYKDSRKFFFNQGCLGCSTYTRNFKQEVV